MLKNKKTKKTLQKIMTQLQHDFGDGMVQFPVWKEEEKTVISSGFEVLDQALGCGGWPAGKMVEIYGLPSTGKTLLALHAIRECQQKGGLCAFLDLDRGLYLPLAKDLGVDLDSLLFCRPESGEQAIQLIRALCEQNIDLVVIYSVASLISKKEIDANNSEPQGNQAMLLNSLFRSLLWEMSHKKTCWMFLNQVRAIQTSQGKWIHSSIGGYALKFYAALRVQLLETPPTPSNLATPETFRVQARIEKNRFTHCLSELSWDIPRSLSKNDSTTNLSL